MPNDTTHLEKFDFENRAQPLTFIETTKVIYGVECDVYAFDGDSAKDLGVIRIQPGCKTPLQKVLKGDKTIEGYTSGKGKLVIIKPGNKRVEYPVDESTKKPFTVTVAVGEQMQWQADPGSPLVVWEICFPPYENGRYEDINE